MTEIWLGRVLWQGYVHPHTHPYTQLKKLGIPHTHTHTQSIRRFPIKTGMGSGNTHGAGFICHLYLLESEELYFPLVFCTIQEVFLHESCLEVSLGYLFCLGLHQLPHPYPPVLSIGHQEEGDKGQLMCISALYKSTDFLALFGPSICLIGSGFAHELKGLVPHEILHSHWTNGCSSIISPPPVSHRLSMPHFQLFTPNSSS